MMPSLNGSRVTYPCNVSVSKELVSVQLSNKGNLGTGILKNKMLPVYDGFKCCACGLKRTIIRTTLDKVNQ
jgi:hypothetical protein